jgi:hypothetical protein
VAIYNIYNNDKELKIFRDNINIFSLILGPLVFLIYGMWKEFLIYVYFLLANSLLLSKGIATTECYLMLLSVILIYIAIDCKNRYQQHLLARGYVCVDKIIAANKLEAEIKYLQK